MSDPKLRPTVYELLNLNPLLQNKTHKEIEDLVNTVIWLIIGWLIVSVKTYLIIFGFMILFFILFYLYCSLGWRKYKLIAKKDAIGI